MIVLLIAVVALVFTLFVLALVLAQQSGWFCSQCGAIRTRTPDGWKRCKRCGSAIHIETER